MVEKLLKEGGRLRDTKRDDTVFLCGLCFAAVLAMAPNSFQPRGKCGNGRSTRLPASSVLKPRCYGVLVVSAPVFQFDVFDAVTICDRIPEKGGIIQGCNFSYHPKFLFTMHPYRVSRRNTIPDDFLPIMHPDGVEGPQFICLKVLLFWRL